MFADALTPRRKRPAWRAELGSGAQWQRDSFEIFISRDYAIAASWRVRLTDERLAETLARELADARPELLVHHAGAEIALRAAESAEVLETWTDFDACEIEF